MGGRCSGMQLYFLILLQYVRLVYSSLSMENLYALTFSYIQKTVTMRKKEGLADYRYFPEPDLPGVTLTEEYVDSIRESLPELPEDKRRRYEKMGLSMQDVLFLANDINVSASHRQVLLLLPYWHVDTPVLKSIKLMLFCKGLTCA